MTRVKAAGLLNKDEAMKLAGIQSLTIAPDLLRTLSSTAEAEIETIECSLFQKNPKLEGQGLEHMTFVDDEGRFRESFVKSEGGKGQAKTAQVRALFTRAYTKLMITQAIGIFCEYQIKAEAMMKDPDLTRFG